ncbi:MAG: response regulator [Pseudomonadota bacterium]
MKRVLLVDDHDMVRQLLRDHIAQVDRFEVVGEARSGEEALRFVRHRAVDVVVLDINMPGMGGFEASRLLRKGFPTIKIIVLSVHGDGAVPQKVLELGVHGYLTKSSALDDVVKALDAVCRERFFIDQKIGQTAVLRGLGGHRSPIESLTPREFEVLSHIVKGRRIIDIAARLARSPKTISTLRSRICEKLGAQSDVELTLIAARLGLIEFNDSAEATYVL